VGHHAMVERGLLPANQVPFVDVCNALVDPSVLNVSMPKSLIQQLDLMPCRARTGRTTTGLVSRQVHAAVRLTVQDRECASDVVEVPDDHPVVIGRLPLQLLDFVIDPSGQRLIGNPAHSGEQMIEMYQMSSLAGIQ
jgi:hypothetical protein